MANEHIPAPVSFEYKGKEYWLSPGVFFILRQIEMKLKSDCIADAKAVAEGESEPVRMKMLLWAAEKQSELGIGSKSFSLAMNSPRYQPFILQLLLQKRHPEVTLSLCQEIYDEKYLEILELVNQMFGMSAPDPKV